jgi:integrase/recombinase XerD
VAQKSKSCASTYFKLPLRRFTMMDILEQFTAYLQQIGYSKGSRYQLPSCAKEFLEAADKPFSAITQSDILDFYAYLQTRPLKRREGALSEAMINHYVTSLKTFFSWLEQTQQIKYNPISNIKFKRPQGNPREPLSQQEINAFSEAPPRQRKGRCCTCFIAAG